MPSTKYLANQSARKRGGGKTRPGEIALGWETWVRLTPTSHSTCEQDKRSKFLRQEARFAKEGRITDAKRSWRVVKEKFMTEADFEAEREEDEIKHMSIPRSERAREKIRIREGYARIKAKREWINMVEEAEEMNREHDARAWEEKKRLAREMYLRSKEIARTVGRNRTRPGGVDYQGPSQQEESK